MKPLRVWRVALSVPAWMKEHTKNRQVIAVVAAKSRAAAARALDVLPSFLKQWGAETGNQTETSIALGTPGRVFMRGIDDREQPFRAAPTSTVLYFSATWCQPCVAFGPRVEELAKAAGVDVIKIDVDDPPIEFAQAAKEIRSVPLLRWVGDRPGAQSLSGAVKRETLAAWFKVGVEDSKR